ncbi:hypothetical protein [Ornithinimicrobium sediminis]|uniref:hypothetical protein n=1 Tax=Ornithinimicrobium sediminis TaxID=2904603 RepID=UPI001E55F61E|nr:hypothetical protein [Ornithinimicrobium sediminis]MCE0485259.1 hypothetical protein [Ornithinimicrobium sediminis]
MDELPRVTTGVVHERPARLTVGSVVDVSPCTESPPLRTGDVLKVLFERSGAEETGTGNLHLAVAGEATADDPGLPADGLGPETVRAVVAHLDDQGATLKALHDQVQHER